MSLLSISLGFVFGPLLAAAFLNLESHAKVEEEMPFLVLGVFSLGSMLMLLYLIDEEPKRANTVQARSLKLNEGLDCFKQALRTPRVRDILLVFVAMQIGWATYFLFIDNLLTERFAFDRKSITLFVACLEDSGSVSQTAWCNRSLSSSSISRHWRSWGSRQLSRRCA